MRRREVVAIVVALLLGFIAYEIIGRDADVDPAEVPGAEQMRAYVAALPAEALLAAYPPEAGLPTALPEGGGQLALVGSPGEIYFTRRVDRMASVRILRASGEDVIFMTAADRRLELVGAHGPELFLRLVDEPFEGPEDVWTEDDVLVLDVLDPARGLYSRRLPPDVIAMLRESLARQWGERPPEAET